MSQKKAAPPAKPAAKPTAKPAAPAAKGAAAKPGKPEGKPRPPEKPVTEDKTVAYDPLKIDDFILGRITLGEMEGIGKDVQYQLAEKGFRVLNEGKLDMAKTIFRGLLALDPTDSYFHTAYASACQRAGAYEEAEKSYTLALKFNPYNSAAFANRGELRFQQGRVLEAAEDIKHAVENDPQGKDPATLRARVLAIAISEVIKENEAAILAELKKNQAKAPAKGAPPAKGGAPSKPGATPAKPGTPPARGAVPTKSPPAPAKGTPAKPAPRK